MTRRVFAVVALIVLLCCVALGTAVTVGTAQVRQSSASRPEFEVASIRSAIRPDLATLLAGGELRGSAIDGSHLDFEFVVLSDLLCYAFRVKPYQLVAPSWARDVQWTVLATLPTASTLDQVPEMMRRLLVERFKLEFHLEKREQQVYRLQIAPGG